MVSKWQSNIEKLDVKKHFQVKTDLIPLTEELVAQYVAEDEPKVENEEEALYFLARHGLGVTDMQRNDIILEACKMGYITIVSTLLADLSLQSIVNKFNEGLIHYAAKG